MPVFFLCVVVYIFWDYTHTHTHTHTYIYIYIYITKENVILILFMFCWDASCGEVSGIIQSQVVPWMDGFITRVSVNFDENLTHWMCRSLNTYDCLMLVKLWSQPWYLFWGNYFTIILVRLIQLETGELYTEKINTCKWEGFVRFNIFKGGGMKFSCLYD